MGKKNRKPLTSQANPSPDEPAKRSPARLWFFRLTAAVLLPCILFGLLELGLRISGSGYPTSFFLTKEIGGKRVLIENDKFGFRFFPPELARSPSPLVMEAQKPENTCRIFVLGESAALGDPEPAFGFGRFLQVLLEKRFPEMRFEVVCTAMTAINSHALVPIARECADHQGDIWVVYMGNNEFVGPFGPSTVFGPQMPPLSAIHFSLALKKMRIGQLLSKLVARKPNEKSWGGMKMFLDHQVPPNDPRKQKVYDYFRFNLDAILATAKSSGAKVVLSTVGVNLRDCPPFASAHGSLREDQKSSWQNSYDAALQAQDGGNNSAALTNFEAAAKIDPAFAELQFRWGQNSLALTNSADAKQHFELARNDDSLPFRTDDRLNSIVREVASRHSTQDVRLVDAAAQLATRNPTGIPGRESFFEHVHLNFEGNYFVAKTIADAITGLLPNAAQTNGPADWASFEQCAHRLALTDWDVSRVYETLQHRLSEPPFINQTGHAAQMEILRQAIAAAKSRLTRDAALQARTTYEQAVAAAPKDIYLHADFAKFNEDTGNFTNAAKQWQAVLEEIPFAPGPHFYLGKVLSAQNQATEALQEFDTALAIRTDLPDALVEKGRLLLKINRAEEGFKELDKAAKFEPLNPRIPIEKAQALAILGRRGEAVGQLQLAVRMQPNYWEAHYLLGVELAFENNIQLAAEQFLETVRLSPNYPLGHLNLGIALAKLNRIEQAITQFQETLRLDPKNQKAAEYLSALQTQHERKGGTPQ